jgi:hypothetical protein
MRALVRVRMGRVERGPPWRQQPCPAAQGVACARAAPAHLPLKAATQWSRTSMPLASTSRRWLLGRPCSMMVVP